MKNLPWLILIAILVFAVWFAEHTLQERSKAGLQSVIDDAHDSLRTTINYLHQSIGEKTLIQASLAQLQKAHPEDLSRIESRFQAREVALRAYLTAEFEARGKGETIVRTIYVPGDTIKVNREQKFEAGDRFLTFSGEIRDSVLSYAYTYQDTIDFIVQGRRKNFLSQKKYFVDGVLSNPQARIKNMRGTEIATFREKRFSVGPFIGWSPFNPNQPVVGIGLQYNLVKF